ncbi:MAG TPA: hypothetical protein VMD53_11220, partial [Rhizomicrobium sp.]|nr:hypothetical protein [Rhizomicrobium sp.]
ILLLLLCLAGEASVFNSEGDDLTRRLFIAATATGFWVAAVGLAVSATGSNALIAIGVFAILGFVLSVWAFFWNATNRRFRSLRDISAIYIQRAMAFATPLIVLLTVLVCVDGGERLGLFGETKAELRGNAKDWRQIAQHLHGEADSRLNIIQGNDGKGGLRRQVADLNADIQRWKWLAQHPPAPPKPKLVKPTSHSNDAAPGSVNASATFKNCPAGSSINIGTFIATGAKIGVEAPEGSSICMGNAQIAATEKAIDIFPASPDTYHLNDMMKQQLLTKIPHDKPTRVVYVTNDDLAEGYANEIDTFLRSSKQNMAAVPQPVVIQGGVAPSGVHADIHAQHDTEVWILVGPSHQ